MTASTAQIIQLYEELDAPPSEIAQALALDVGVVELALAAHSQKRRRELAGINPNQKLTQARSEKAANQLYSETEVKEAAGIIAELMRHTEDDNTRLRAAKLVMDEGQGRRNIQNLSKIQINVTYFNERLQRAREARDAAVNKIIDIPPETSQLLEAQ